MTEEKKDKLSWNVGQWGKTSNNRRSPYNYDRTGPWNQYKSKEELEHIIRLGSEDGDRMFRELARSLLVGHAAVIVISINTAANLFSSNTDISCLLPLIAFFGVCGSVSSGFAQYFLALHAQAVGAGYEAFKNWRFSESVPTKLDDEALAGFETSQSEFRVLWDSHRVVYRSLLLCSLLLFALALTMAVIYMFSVS